MSNPFDELCRRLADEQRWEPSRRSPPVAPHRQPLAAQRSCKIDVRAMTSTFAKAERTLNAAALDACGGFTIGQGVKVTRVDGGFQVLGPWAGDRMLLRKVAGGMDPRAAFTNEQADHFLADRADLTPAPEFDAGCVATADETLKIAAAVADVRAAKERLRARFAAAHAQVQRDVEAGQLTAFETAKRIGELHAKARRLGL